jgi:hypothetical protein
MPGFSLDQAAPDLDAGFRRGTAVPCGRWSPASDDAGGNMPNRPIATASHRVAVAEARLAQQRRLLREARDYGSPEWVSIAENSCTALETALTCFRLELAACRQDRV